MFKIGIGKSNQYVRNIAHVTNHSKFCDSQTFNKKEKIISMKKVFIHKKVNKNILKYFDRESYV